MSQQYGVHLAPLLTLIRLCSVSARGCLLWLTAKLTGAERVRLLFAFLHGGFAAGYFSSLAAEQCRSAVYWWNGCLFTRAARESGRTFLLGLSHRRSRRRRSSQLAVVSCRRDVKKEFSYYDLIIKDNTWFEKCSGIKRNITLC